MGKEGSRLLSHQEAAGEPEGSETQQVQVRMRRSLAMKDVGITREDIIRWATPVAHALDIVSDTAASLRDLAEEVKDAAQADLERKKPAVGASEWPDTSGASHGNGPVPRPKPFRRRADAVREDGLASVLHGGGEL